MNARFFCFRHFDFMSAHSFGSADTGHSQKRRFIGFAGDQLENFYGPGIAINAGEKGERYAANNIGPNKDRR